MILSAIQNRRSIRNYKSDPISDDQIHELLKAAAFAPSSKHNHSIEFIVVRETKTKKSLYELLGQGFLKQAPVLIIPVIDTHKSQRPVQDLAVASENIFIQATSMGLGSVWKNIPEEKQDCVKSILQYPETFLAINVIPIGLPKTTRRSHTDTDFNPKSVHYETW